MSKDTACCIKLPGHTYFIQVAIQIDEVFMKKCPVSCHIVMCMQDLNVKLFSLYSLALKGQVFPGLLSLNLNK